MCDYVTVISSHIKTHKIWPVQNKALQKMS